MALDPHLDFAPVLCGAGWRLVPPGTPAVPGRIDLVLERGAFGSGEHETTAACLTLLEELPRLTGARVLDFGSGTGVLALAALKRGAARAVCVDIAAEAVALARRNAAHNGYADEVEHLCGTLADVVETGFDLVLANIYADILLAEAEALIARTRPGGLLLLSGVLWQDNFPVKQAYERGGCVVERNLFHDEFTTLLLRRG